MDSERDRGVFEKVHAILAAQGYGIAKSAQGNGDKWSWTRESDSKQQTSTEIFETQQEAATSAVEDMADRLKQLERTFEHPALLLTVPPSGWDEDEPDLTASNLFDYLRNEFDNKNIVVRMSIVNSVSSLVEAACDCEWDADAARPASSDFGHP